MDNLIGLILGMIVFCFLLVFLVGFTELAVPIIVKADFDRICRNYLDQAIEDSGLSALNENALITEIEGINDDITVNSTNITRPNTVAHKGRIDFEIEASYQRNAIINLFNRENKTYTLQYSKTFTNRKIIN